MSDRRFEIVLRIPCSLVGVEEPWEFYAEHADKFAALDEDLGFHVAPTTRPFFDYVLKVEQTEKDPYGEMRALTQEEKEEYGPLFTALFPKIDLDHVRYVEFVWDGENTAPNYYMPCLVRSFTIYNLFTLMKDQEFIDGFWRIDDMLGKTGRMRLKCSGIPQGNQIFVEGETEELCEQVLLEIESFLREKGYSELPD